jgi:hypothetical protein
VTRARTRALALAAAAALLAGTTAAVSAPAAQAATGPTLTVDASALGPVIPDTVYGASFAPPALANAIGIAWTRWGGNATSRYDYRTDYTNTGSDWYFENVQQSPGLESFLVEADTYSLQASVTVPMTGWVAKDATSCGFPTATYGSQDDTDSQWRPQCGNGVSGGSDLAVTQPATLTSKAFTTDDMTTMAAWVKGYATQRPAIYHLDNEPSLWTSTHRDVVTAPETSTAFFARSAAAAAAVKAGDAGSIVAGPGEWGWCSWFFFPHDGGCGPGTESATAGVPYAQAYLAAMRAAEVAKGSKLLDVFDEHFYPQGTGIFGSDPKAAGDAATQARRLRSVRGLWDPTYTDESWISGTAYPQPQLIPRMRQWVDAVYTTGSPAKPALGISEYSFGAIDTVNGALAQADALGVLGREGVQYAALWTPPATTTSPGAFAFRMFRNLDGSHSAFGTQSVLATSDDTAVSHGSQDGQGTVSVYAAKRADGRLSVVLINKTSASVTSPLRITGTKLAPTALRYQWTGASPTTITATQSAVSGFATGIALPAQSITTLIISPATASTLSLSPATGTVATYPAAVTLRAVLRTGGTGVAGARVRFESRPAGSLTWTKVADATTSATGAATTSVTPSRHMEYRVRDIRPASLTVVPAAARSITVFSRRSATLSASRTTLPLGTILALSGKAYPGAAGRTATLQRRTSTGWATVATRTVSSTSAFSFTVRPSARGKATYRAVVSADTAHYAAVSPSRTVSVS